MKKTIITPSRARAVGVITPPLADMLAIDEETNTNHFHDIRVKRSNDVDNTYKGVVRKTQTIMGDKLEVDIVVDQVIFYKEYPERGWFGLSVYVDGTDTRVNRGNLKIYVRDVDGIMDADVLIKEYNINDSISLGWQIGNLNWQPVLDAFAAKNKHPFRWFNVKVVYTDSTHYYMNKTVYPPRRIGYSTHPVIRVMVDRLGYLPTENSHLADMTYPVKETTLVERTSPVELDWYLHIYAWVRDACDDPIIDVPLTVHVQDTQEPHTINGNTYGVSGDIELGYTIDDSETGGNINYNYIDTGNDNLTHNGIYPAVLRNTNTAGRYHWVWKIPAGFMDTTQSRNYRHIFTTLFLLKNDLLFPGGNNIRAASGFEYRIRWDYNQPVIFRGVADPLDDTVEYDDLSTYAIRNFKYLFDVLDPHGTPAPTKVKVLVNGVTLKDSNDTQILFDRTTLNGVSCFNVEFDWKYLHQGDNIVTLKCISDYDYAGSIDILCYLPYLHYNISSPNVTGSWDGTGIVELEYIVGTIENDELPYCDVWDLKLDDVTLVARDKRVVDGEWTGEYTDIVGLPATSLDNYSYNPATGRLWIKFRHGNISSGSHQLKLVLPQTEAIAGGNHTTTITVDNRVETWMSNVTHLGINEIGLDVTLYRADTNSSLSGKTIKFYIDDNYQGSSTTSGSGVASYVFTGVNSGSHVLKAVFEGDTDYKTSTWTGMGNI